MGYCGYGGSTLGYCGFCRLMGGTTVHLGVLGVPGITGEPVDTGVQGDTGGYGEYKGVLRETVGYWRLLMDTLQYAHLSQY